LTLFFLNEIDEGLHKRGVVLVFQLRFRGCDFVLLDGLFLRDFGAVVGCAGAASFNTQTLLGGGCNDLAGVLAADDALPTESLAASPRKIAPPFGRRPGLSSDLGHGDATATETVAFALEAFARVALAKQGLVLVTEFVPQRMERLIVRPVDDVAQFVEHRVQHVFEGEELRVVAWVAEAQTDLLATVDV
jgi:hypothetical protein